MKKSVFALMVFCSLLAFTGSAAALTVDLGATNVGVVDTKIDQSTLLSGAAAELAWVQSILGNDVSFITKQDNLTSANWKQTSEIGTWALPLLNSPDYFLVKTGNNRTKNNFVDYLFNNNDLKSWAVLDLDDIYVTQVTNIDKVSYVSEYNGAAPAPVPEPATMLLLGAGMFGLGFYRKSRMNKA